MNQDMDDVADTGPIPAFGVPGVGTQQTYSFWMGGLNPKLDINTMATDLSVQRHLAVERWDSRFTPAQVHADFATDQSIHIYLPN